MKVYWLEDTEEVKEVTEHGNKIYETEEKWGILAGSHHVRHSGYPKILIAVEGGKFISKASCDCYHKEL